MQPRTLSSSLTFFSKFVWPMMFLGAVAWASTLSEPNMTPTGQLMKWAGVIFFAAACIWMLWVAGGLKRVRIDSDFLYVSNYLRETAIPLDMIDRVREYWWINPGYVAVHFRQPTVVGSQIRFLAKWEVVGAVCNWMRLFGVAIPPHPVIAELKNAADRPI